MNVSIDQAAADRAQQDRILDLYAAGHTTADICALGHRDWTRARVQHVADLHGLTLDAAGRWTHRPRSRTAPPAVPAQRRHTDREARR